MEQFTIEASDGNKLAIYHWPCPNSAKGVVHIAHGMAEHARRYDWMAQQLNLAGYHVYAQDHRGHGNTEQTLPGHYADQNGWDKVVDDLLTVNRSIKQKHQLPITLFGHSMGSFICQGFAIKHGDQIDQLILSGSNYQKAPIYQAARLVAKAEQLRQGPKGKSKMLDFLTFGSFNKAFKPNRTDFDWLSREPEQVDAYINDPQCGFICSNQTWIQLLGGLIYISDLKNLSDIPANLPIYLLGGEEDPVGLKGKGLRALKKALDKSGHSDVIIKQYVNGRHEMFNESNRQEVFNDMQEWLLNHSEERLAS